MPRPGVHLLTALLLAGSGAAGAQTISVSGNPGLLRISSAVAGSEPLAVTNSTTTYQVTTPIRNVLHKVVAQLNATMPAELVLTGNFTAPPGATSLGPVALDMTARDVVTGIPRSTNSTQGISYTLSATVLAGVVPSTSRIVTLTIVRAP